MDKYSILLFDGVCNLCNDSVQFVIKHRRKDEIRFASLQSQVGLDLLEKYGIENNLNTIVLIENNQAFIKSSAALRVAGKLKFPYALMKIFLLVPPFIRNGVYDFIAKNRYRWYGKKEFCMIPTPELKALFLD